MRSFEGLLLVWSTLVIYLYLSQYPVTEYISTGFNTLLSNPQDYRTGIVFVALSPKAWVYVIALVALGLNFFTYQYLAHERWHDKHQESTAQQLQRVENVAIDIHRLAKHMATKLSLDDARRLAPSRMSRKDLHRITQNTLRRRLQDVQTRLDAAQFKNARKDMWNLAMATSLREFETQISMVSSKWKAKASEAEEALDYGLYVISEQKGYIQALYKDNLQLRTELQSLQKPHSDTHILNQTKADQQVLHEEQLDILTIDNEKLRAIADEQTQTLAQKSSELENVHDVHRSELARKDNDMQRMCEEHSVALLLKNNDMYALRQIHDATVTQHNTELKDMRKQHTATIAAKDAEMEIQQSENDHIIASICEEMNKLRKISTLKDNDIVSLQSRLSAVETSSNEKITELQSQLNTAKEVHAGDIHDLCAQYAAHSSSQTPTLDSDQRYKALQQEFNTLRKKFVANSDALEITDNEFEAAKREWANIYIVVQEVNGKLPNALTGLGKKRYSCQEEIVALIRNDPDMKLKGSEITQRHSMAIRRGCYELETIWTHHLKFLKAFAEQLIEQYPAAAELAKSVAATLPTITPELKAVTSTAGTLSSKPAKYIPLPGIVAQCICKYSFFKDDPIEAKKEHIDRCDEYQAASDEKKTLLLSNIGLGVSVPKLTRPRQAELTCNHCSQKFSNAQSEWFFSTHVPACIKKYKSRLPAQPEPSSPATFSGPNTPAARSNQQVALPLMHSPNPSAPSFYPSGPSFQPATPAATTTTDTPTPTEKGTKHTPAPAVKSSGGLVGRSKHAVLNHVPRTREHSNNPPTSSFRPSTPATNTPSTPNTTSIATTNTPAKVVKSSGGLIGSSKHADPTYVSKMRERGNLHA